MARFSSHIYWYVVAVVTCNGVFVNSHSDLKNVFERREIEEYRECVGNFEIHQDKIIRTEESKRMGAKYLNEKEVTSKDECVQFCCKTPNCNVFVLEEKVFNRVGTNAQKFFFELGQFT